MNIAGKFLPLAQGIAESALLSRLRSKYRMQFNLEKLADQAKQELNELNIPITPTSLLNTADDIASRQETMLIDTIGLEHTRWNPIKREYEEYIVPDPRAYFIR